MRSAPRLLRSVNLLIVRPSLRQLVRELPWRELLPLGAAIALLFSVLGPAMDLLNGGRWPLSSVVRAALFSAVIANGFAFGSLRRNYPLLAATAVVQIALTITAPRFGSDAGSPITPAELSVRLRVDAIMILSAMIGGYTCFLIFLNGAAARYLRIRTEMELAHRVHQVLVPSIDTRIGRFEFFGLSAASGEMGGDLVDVVPSKVGWFGYVADVSGHGVSSGVVMGMFKSGLRMRLLQGGPLENLLADLNRVLYPLKSSNMFVTAACVRAREHEHALDYAVAGHLPILRLGRGAAAVEEITTPQIPIGMFEDYTFVSSQIHCGRGDLLLLITDGLTEVFDARDREFGIEAIKDLLLASASLPLSEIANRIVSAARAHGVQIDDQTLLLIRAV